MEKAISKFFEERCMEERGATCRAVKLYEEFAEWWTPLAPLPSRKLFFSLVPVKYLRVKIVGAMVYRELRIRSFAAG